MPEISSIHKAAGSASSATSNESGPYADDSLQEKEKTPTNSERKERSLNRSSRRRIKFVALKEFEIQTGQSDEEYQAARRKQHSLRRESHTGQKRPPGRILTKVLKSMRNQPQRQSTQKLFTIADINNMEKLRSFISSMNMILLANSHNPQLSYAEATSHLHHCINKMSVVPQESCHITLRFIHPPGTGRAEFGEVGDGIMFTCQTSLPMLISMLQVEFDLYFQDFEGLPQLISSVEIDTGEHHMPRIPALGGQLVHLEHDLGGDLGATHVIWECSNSLQEGSVGHYWYTYRLWLLKLAGLGCTSPVFTIHTVPQVIKDGEWAGDSHQFIRDPNEQLDDSGSVDAEYADVEFAQRYQEYENERFRREKDREGIDYTFLAKLRARLDVESRALPLRPSTPELVLLSKMINFDEHFGSNRPTYDEMVEMQAAMRRLNYPGLPALTLKSVESNGSQTGSKHEDRRSDPKERIDWRYYQRLGGDRRSHAALDLENVPFEEAMEWTYVEYHDPAYKDAYGPLQSIHMIDLARKKSVMEKCKVDFEAARNFQAEDDEIFCFSLSDLGETSHGDDKSTRNVEGGRKDSNTSREDLSKEVALRNLERYTLADLGAAENRRNTTQQVSQSVMNGEVKQNTPKLNATAPIYHALTTNAEMNHSVQNSFPTFDEWMASPAMVAAPPSPFGGGLFTPYSTSQIQTSNFGPLTSGFSMPNPLTRYANPGQHQHSHQTPYQGRNAYMPYSPSMFRNLNSHPPSTGTSGNPLVSPFAHRYPVRFDSSTGALPSTATFNASNAPNAMQYTPTPKASNYTSVQNQPRTSSPLRNSLIGGGTTNNAPDQAYGTSLRLQNHPKLA